VWVRGGHGRRERHRRIRASSGERKVQEGEMRYEEEDKWRW
jgi:hypothetical protein